MDKLQHEYPLPTSQSDTIKELRRKKITEVIARVICQDAETGSAQVEFSTFFVG